MKQNPQQGQKQWQELSVLCDCNQAAQLQRPLSATRWNDTAKFNQKKIPKPFLIFEDEMQVVGQIREQRNKLWHPKATHTPKSEKQRCLSEAEHPVQERLIFAKCAAMFSSFGGCQTMKEKINKNFSA